MEERLTQRFSSTCNNNCKILDNVVGEAVVQKYSQIAGLKNHRKRTPSLVFTEEYTKLLKKINK